MQSPNERYSVLTIAHGTVLRDERFGDLNEARETARLHASSIRETKKIKHHLSIKLRDMKKSKVLPIL